MEKYLVINVSDRADLEQINKMLKDVFKYYRQSTGRNKIPLHSDQGWQYQHKDYQNALANTDNTKYVQKGDLLDNSVMENFFGIMKSELLYPRSLNPCRSSKRNLRNILIGTIKKRIK